MPGSPLRAPRGQRGSVSGEASSANTSAAALRAPGIRRLFHSCPAHDDRNTLHLRVREASEADGRVLLRCIVGCGQDEVLAALTEKVVGKTDLLEHCQMFEKERGVSVSVATMSRAVRKLGWSFKKDLWHPPRETSKEEMLSRNT